MGKRIFVALAVLMLAPRLAASARADSDGYYCVGPHYLAYQFGFAAPSPKPHRLFVVSLDRPRVVGPPIGFDLPNFQVHGMVCEQERILVAAFDRLYTVTLDHRGEPRTFSQALYEKAGVLPPEIQPPQRNLGGWSRPVGTLQVERIQLPARAGTSVVLEILPRPAIERCVTLIKTRVVVSDSRGQIGELTVFEGHGRRACGENHERGSDE